MTAVPENRVDPDVVIPAPVRAAAARAEELSRQIIPAPAPASTPTEEEPTITIVEEPALTPTPVESTIPAPTPEPPKPAPENWEHKYNSMKGRFETAERARAQLAARVSDLERLLSLAQATTVPQTPAPQATETASARLITAEEESDYGKDFLGVVGKKAKEELTPEIATLRNEIQQLKAQLGGVTGVVSQDATQRMYASLELSVTNWSEINTNPKFIAWLGLPDPYSGAIRSTLLNAAFQRHDATRLAAFFKGFISDEAATNPARREPDNRLTSPGNTGEVPKVSLESLAAPGRAKTAASTPPAEKPTITRAQIAAFYSAVRAGKYAGKEAEKNRIEQQIIEASRTGRVLN